jgi:hypothetical protein
VKRNNCQGSDYWIGKLWGHFDTTKIKKEFFNLTFSFLQYLCLCTSVISYCRHFFFTAMLYTYGRFLSRQLVNTVTSEHLLYKVVSGLIKYQMFICYFLYIAGRLIITFNM